jgi:hypothetical protein
MKSEAHDRLNAHLAMGMSCGHMSTSSHWMQCVERMSNPTNLQSGSHGRAPSAASAARPLSSSANSGGSAGSSSPASSCTSAGGASDYDTAMNRQVRGFVASDSR